MLFCCNFCGNLVENVTKIGKWGSMLLSIDLLLCFGDGPICLMVTQSALDWRLGGKPGPLPCSAGIRASWWVMGVFGWQSQM